MDKKRGPGIYLLTDTGNLVEITLTWMDGQETHFPRSLPRRRWWTSWVLTLGDYRSRVEGLWEEHCVFEERDEVPYIDLLDLRKDGPAWETITAESQILRAQGDMRASMTGISFSQRVLIATKVLDNGINLKDPSLRHIVIEAYEKTTFLQMLGRKRQIDTHESIHLYLKNISEGNLRKKFRNQILEIFGFWYRLYKIQERRSIQEDMRFELMNFLGKYTSNGHYKRSYTPFVVEKNYILLPMGGMLKKTI